MEGYPLQQQLPILAARHLLTLVKQKDNAEIISAEIQGIQGKYGVSGEEPKIPDVPCPYTALLLGTSWTIDLEPKDPAYIYASGVSFKNAILPADMGSADGGESACLVLIVIVSLFDTFCLQIMTMVSL
jgi:hypothetical protein